MNAYSSTRTSHVEVAELISIGAYKLITAVEAAINAVARWIGR